MDRRIPDTTGMVFGFLSDCTYSEHKAQFQNRVMEQICVGGYEKVDRIMANKEGNLISKDWEENEIRSP